VDKNYRKYVEAEFHLQSSVKCGFTAQIFTELTTAELHCVIFVEFYPNWTRNMESGNRNLFLPWSKLWQSLNTFSWNKSYCAKFHEDMTYGLVVDTTW